MEMMNRVIEQIAAVQREGDNRFLAMEEKRMKLEEKMLLSLQSSMAMFQQAMMHGRGYQGGFYPTGPQTPPYPQTSRVPTQPQVLSHGSSMYSFPDPTPPLPNSDDDEF